jgi:hypothetical protein
MRYAQRSLALLTFSLCAASLVVLGAGHNPILRAHLTGGAEVPPAETDATGQAIFRLNKDGTSLHYRLIVANIENVTQAHIHMAPAGVNGPVVAFLFGPVAGVSDSGVIAEGDITAADLTGPLAGEPLSALVESIQAGNAYVNVHTVAIPSGEIRGQIQ